MEHQWETGFEMWIAGLISGQFRPHPSGNFDFTCKRVSAKHGVKDDFAFLWEHASFRHPPNKNPFTDRSEIFHS
jgi:hypothetical protein